MIEPEEIARWAELYDLGFNNLDMTSREADAARREPHRMVRERYLALFPGRSVTFNQFNARGDSQNKSLLEAFAERLKIRASYSSTSLAQLFQGQRDSAAWMQQQPG